MARCKECGAEIIFIPTKAGKSMPCDAPQVMYRGVKGGKERVVTSDGAVLACEIVEDAARAHGVGHIPHWATCSGVGRFRKKT